MLNNAEQHSCFALQFWFQILDKAYFNMHFGQTISSLIGPNNCSFIQACRVTFNPNLGLGTILNKQAARSLRKYKTSEDILC